MMTLGTKEGHRVFDKLGVILFEYGKIFYTRHVGKETWLTSPQTSGARSFFTLLDKLTSQVNKPKWPGLGNL